MILVDTSAWVEFLRGTGSEACRALDELLRTEAPIAVTDTVFMEVLAGARDTGHARRLRRLLDRARALPTRPFLDHEEAAGLYRACRAAGDTPRSLVDCLIAVVAIRAGATVLHHDRDFALIADHAPLRVGSR